MSDIQNQPSEHPDGPPDQSLLPPAGAGFTGEPVAAWAPPPPVTNSVWHQIAAGVVIAAVVATAAGAGIGWSLARTIDAHNRVAQNNAQPATYEPAQPGSPIKAAPNTGGGLNTDAIAAKVDPAIVDINTVVGSGQAAGTGEIITSNGEILTNNHVVDRSTS